MEIKKFRDGQPEVQKLVEAISKLNKIIIEQNEEIETLKQKISIGKYLREIEASLVAAVGDKAATAMKLGLIVFSFIVLIANAFLCIAILLGIVLGTFAAKASLKISAVSAYLNRIAAYINRLR